MTKSIVEIIRRKRVEDPNKTAFIINEEKISYLKLYEEMKSYASYLYRCGFKRGDFVLAKALCSKYYFIAMYGTFLAGGVFVPLEKDYSEKQFQSIKEEIGNCFLIISDSEVGEFQELNCQCLNYSDFSTILKETKDDFIELADNDLALIPFTTGTTGKAKGVCLPYRYFVETSFYLEEIPYREKTVMMISIPLNHVFGIGRTSTTLCHGGTVVVCDGLNDLELFYKYIKYEGVNAFALTPSAINYLLALTKDQLLENKEQYEFFEIGGEKLPKALQERYIDTFKGVHLFIGYASTETGVISTYEFSKYGPTDNRVGRKTKEIKLLDENGNEFMASKNHPGFIGFSASWIMISYYNAPEATEKAKKNDTILMSDYGYEDEEGYLCLAGRSGDVIISGAYKIDPTEVENAALSLGTINDCVCIGKKDEIFGYKAALLVVMKNNEVFSKSVIKKSLMNILENYKVPKAIEQVERIQRNKNGKIDRKYYREIEG